MSLKLANFDIYNKAARLRHAALAKFWPRVQPEPAGLATIARRKHRSVLAWASNRGNRAATQRGNYPSIRQERALHTAHMTHTSSFRDCIVDVRIQLMWRGREPAEPAQPL